MLLDLRIIKEEMKLYHKNLLKITVEDVSVRGKSHFSKFVVMLGITSCAFIVIASSQHKTFSRKLLRLITC